MGEQKRNMKFALLLLLSCLFVLSCSLPVELQTQGNIQTSTSVSTNAWLNLPPTAQIALSDHLPHGKEAKPPTPKFQMPHSISEAKESFLTWKDNMPYNLVKNTLGASVAKLMKNPSPNLVDQLK